ncbi:SDR family NAD(P)-dependent oxidoreductase [Prescottella equi]|uniref:SDR family NAD(P)-dependent oxidoreductase n=1 Tax=Rhodococcus hoagii TaxID=43767 RepID=UPI0007CD780E|nr:SDR family NAD(P)-dependent oxidoreductase [Prescottella equi]MBM4483025.1 SDR family oxidoreductase [Prescottella equi]MBM4518280.1 SDR family oxidoreductase [Prescottella equi]MBM4527700.1 SDR family oxidoreductase [Prescottella equi]MBM4546602.1 SDR family oxidoreductase [Prescottella equi]MBM4573423.1 SDR family oxidoreductase [Prescottella equi]
MTSFALDGRTALVTGGGQNTGLGIARTLAEAGAHVIVNDITAERAEAGAAAVREAGGAATPAAFDITSHEEVSAATKKIGEEIGVVDILVNNAGLPAGAQMLPFLETPRHEWNPYIDINIFGSLHMMHALLPGMVEQGWGRVVQISSGSGSVASRGLGGTFYGASKAGIEGAVRHIATEVGPRGVTVNTLALGLMEKLRDAIESKSSPMLNAIWEGNVMQRIGTGDDVGAACLWLCSGAGEFVSGQTIHLNGGSYSGR